MSGICQWMEREILLPFEAKWSTLAKSYGAMRENETGGEEPPHLSTIISTFFVSPCSPRIGVSFGSVVICITIIWASSGREQRQAEGIHNI
jgi:hypothetical protein